MLGILWFIVWATVGEAFYDETKWYTAEDGDTNNLAFDWQRYLRDNFSDNLRIFAKAYRAVREGDDEMSMQKAKSRLRMLKVFKYTGSSLDFESSKGKMLPLSEGAKYCTMGRHTKVDCNHCTCVAGQLYMCTGMICPEQTGRPQFLSTCREGKQRKIDSCNYCFCRNGHEFCSTKDCRLDHGHSALRGPVCHEGQRRRIECNRCVCHNGEEYCTKKDCKESEHVLIDEMHTYHETKPRPYKSTGMEGLFFGRQCVKGSKRKLDSCNVCNCYNGRWVCENKKCGSKESESLLLSDIQLDSDCKLGEKIRLDCHRCICLRDGWKCSRRKTCQIFASPRELLLRSRFLQKCAIGMVYRVDYCNTCWCDRLKRWQCTHYKCPRMSFLDPKKKKEKSCDNFDIKYIECNNRCECVAHHWLCTQRQCNKQKSSGESKPGKQNGDNYMYVETCQPGEVRKLNSCNKCYCRYGQWFCQTKDCDKEEKSEANEPNENPDNIEFNKLTSESNNQEVSENTDNDNDNDDINIFNDSNGEIPNEDPAIIENTESSNDDNPTPQEGCIKGSLQLDQESCEFCECYDGQWSCKIDCSKMEIVPTMTTSQTIEEEEERCRPSSTKKLTCQDCICTLNGKWNCKKLTNRKCREYFANGGMLRSHPECALGRRQRIDACNYCWCNYDRKWKCSNNTCAGRFDARLRKGYDDSETSLNIEDYDDNNFYETLEIGYEYSAPFLRTENLDDIDIAKILGIGSTVPKCKTGNLRKADACNMCFCRSGLWFCEKKPCKHGFFTLDKNKIALSGPALPECLPETKKNHCEMCTCPNGQWTCKNICPSEDGCSYDLRLNLCTMCYCRDGNLSCENDCLEPIPPDERFSKCKDRHSVLIAYKKWGGVCYTCYCNMIQWRCKVRSCSEKAFSLRTTLRTDGTHCREGHRYEVDACNYCVCYNGVQLCTQRLCWNNETTDSYSMEPECLPGKPVPPPDQCNVCVCLNSEILCTQNLCGVRTSDLSIPKCVSGMKKKLDVCNTCTCRRGLWFCENKECGFSRKLRLPMPRGSCSKVGLVTQSLCFNCVCSRHKKWSCTQNTKPSRICRRIKPRHSLRNSETLCIEGKYREVDACNYCVCYEGIEFCTQKSCWNNRPIPPNEMESECLPGEPVPPPDQCNQCVCLNGDILCTANPCRIRSSSGLRSRQITLDSKCKIGSSKKMDCHRCVCYADGWKCKTRKKCRIDPITGKPYLRQLGNQCKAGESYKIDSCNTCSCSSSGMLLCTRRNCPISKAQQRSTSECVEGHKYKLDDGCNYCVCQGGQEFCTARACLVTVPDSTADKNKACTEGEITSAKDGCNMCVCLQGKMTCTNRDCSDMVRNGQDAQELLSSLRMNRKPIKMGSRKRKPTTCIPGETYIEEGEDPDCPNYCICDRNEFLCTKRQCKKNPRAHSEPFHHHHHHHDKEEKIRYPKRVLKQEMCEENQPLPSDDPCNTCICLNDRKVCTIIPCSEADEIKMDSDEVFLGHKAVKTNRINKGNMEKKKKGIFCEPFTFFSPDNNRFCRNCFCLHNGLALCLLNLCKYSKDIPHNRSPQKFNDVCTPGETGYPTKCVTCTCSDEAKWICTREELAFCQERDCDVKDEFHMGLYSFCAGCKCSVKEWYCSIESETCQDYSNVTCPIGTLIHNPKQHCSLCLCGGDEEGSSNMCFTEAKCVRQVLSHLKN